jgi:hypothetical protein
MSKFLSPEDVVRWLADGVPSYADILEVYPDLNRRNRQSERQSVSRILRGAHMLMARDRVIGETTFAIPCREAIEALRDCSPLLEIGAGTGFWSALLSSSGIDVVATDMAGGINDYGQTVGRYHPVFRGDALAMVRENPDCDVLCIWPDLDESWATDVVRILRPGRRFCLIGEAATGDADLRECLRNLCRQEKLVSLPVWPMMNDCLTVHRKVT